ncbi:MAG: 50S ribosomal protein L31e [Candidatus Bathyarchaeia archaeon]|nr:50S ribosomal protein L31e [Candidatus Bathyarchaeota archaeon]
MKFEEENRGKVDELAGKVEEKALEEEEKESEVKKEEVEGVEGKEGEEIKPSAKEEIEKEIVEERFYTIPLGKACIVPPNKRAPKAIRIIRDFIKRHMKLEAKGEEDEAEPKRVIISNEVNERVWSRGIEKPPRKIRVRAAKDKDGNVTVYLAEGD